MNLLLLSISSTDLNELEESLNANRIDFKALPMKNFGTLTADSTIEIVKVVGNPAFWAALASVLIAYIKSRPKRSVIITTKNGDAIHAEGLSSEDLSKVLTDARRARLFEAKEK